MSEWPELEHYRTQLSPLICGEKIIETSVNDESAINLSISDWKASLTLRTILFLEHKGKQLLFHLDDGNRIVLQLITGEWLAYTPQDEQPKGKIAIRIQLSNGYTLYVGGIKSGYMHFTTAKEVIKQAKELGPDPFAIHLTLDQFKRRLKGKKGRLKATLTDQRFLSGIGNVYSDEICFDAKLNPAVTIQELDDAKLEQLYTSMRHVLSESAATGGLCEHPMHAEDTVTGSYRSQLKVAGRTDLPCVNCGQPIKHETISGRKMFFCANCQ
ncbi:MAG: endonuclease VIII [Candidatus Cohnella colombiensis]|uniref:Formamidopyrimidine-DNA glycosylase n=1 Tax=Candidatus Cohnella colombiensis TaxID=3121368 RepID=A0AA95JBT7_9BACL|nr:MAG: endonuclease VIII [Cohnella sp.]